MKISGITRRIDELGRIVIPKEIRNKMHIKKGELLEIYMEDINVISLRKHNTIKEKQDFINKIVKVLASKIKTNVFITNLDEIVFSNLYNAVGKKLILDFENKMFQPKESGVLFCKDLKLSKNYKLYKICPCGDLVGYLIIDDTSKITSEMIDLISFTLNILESYFEE